MAVSWAWAGADACKPNPTSEQISKTVKSTSQNSVHGYVDWGPMGEPMSVIIHPQFKEEGTKGVDLDYRVMVDMGSQDAYAIADPQITKFEIPTKHPLLDARKAQQGDILLTFPLREGTTVWWHRQGSITIVGCHKEEMLFYVTLPTKFSSPKTTGLISLVVTVLMYIFVSRCVYWWEDENGLITIVDLCS
jgi:hypothetical protein